jgi:hypothetical protein
MDMGAEMWTWEENESVRRVGGNESVRRTRETHRRPSPSTQDTKAVSDWLYCTPIACMLPNPNKA